MNTSNDEIHDVFVFCWYPDGWTPRAVIAMISKFDNDALNQMEIMVNAGNLIENIDRGHISRRGIRTSKGFISSESKDENDIRLLQTVSTWTNIADNFYMYKNYEKFCYHRPDYVPNPDYWYNYIYEYYINDANSNLSPHELYKKLLSLNAVPSNAKSESEPIRINVKYCVIVSEIPINFNDNNDDSSYIRSLRFYFKTKYEKGIEIFIRETFDIYDIQICKSDIQNKYFTGYGYLKPKTINQWKSLNNKMFECEHTTISFI